MIASTEQHRVARRSGVTGWPAVVLVGTAFAVAMLGATLPTPFYPAYAVEFGFGVRA